MKKKIYVKKNNYYRKITERLPQSLNARLKKVSKDTVDIFTDKNLIDHYLRFMMFFLAFTFLILDLYVAFVYFNYRSLKQERLKIADNFEYWQDVTKNHPNFPDAYYNAGLYAFQLGDKNSAQSFLDRAIELDPSFVKAIELEKKILK